MFAASAMSPDHLVSRASAELLHASDLTKRYGEDAAISGVSFAVASGEVLGIVGPNGAGKTTLLDVVAGLAAAETGRIVWRGEELHAARRGEALFYLPDGVRPYQDRFAIEVIRFFSDVYRRSAADVTRTVAALELGPVLDKRVHALSKGFNRRLMLAVGLLTPQRILLMDEPFDGFDLRQTRNIIGVIRSEAARGRAFVLAIHQLTDAERVCDRFILLAAGQVRGIGTMQALRAETGIAGGSLEDIFLART